MSDTTNSVPRLIAERQPGNIKDRLWELIDEAKGSDVLAPVTVVGPSRYANLSLRHELGSRGFANVRFIVLPVLSEMLGAPTLAQQGRRPLASFLEGVAVQATLAGATGPLASVSLHPATQTSTRASFRELREAPAEVIDALEQQGEVRSEVVRLFRRFRQETVSQWYDQEDLADAAVESLRARRPNALDELGLIVFYLPNDVTPAETRLIEALWTENRCAVVLGTTGDANADRPAEELYRTLKCDTQANGSPFRQDIPFQLPEGEASLHIAPSAHEELRWVIRQIIAEATERRTPFHRMAILYRAENPYASLIPVELELAGIPLAGPGRDALADTGPGRTLLGLLDLADGTLRRDDVMSWLTGCPISPPSGRTPGFNPSYWDSLSRRAGIVGSIGQWRDSLNRYSRDLERQAERRLAKDEISEGRAGQMRYEATAARNALVFVELLARDLAAPDAGSSWTSHCQWARRLLDTYLSRRLSESDGDAAVRIEDFLEGLSSADSIHSATDLETFRRTVREQLTAPVGQLGPTGSGVFVSSFATANGMCFDAVWLVGMIEGAVPPAVRPDPLLPESGWVAAGGQSRATTRIARERHDYLSALASAPRRTLSYSLADGSSQRQSYPSRWFLEQASELEGRPVYTGDLAELHDRPWLTMTASSELGIVGADDTALADQRDYTMRRLLQWRGAGRRMREHPLVAESSAARAIRAGRSRNLRRFTEFDGILSGTLTPKEFRLNPSGTPVSATSLEAWATCPFRYFLGQVLRLSALETPEETTTISALDRGSLVHDILEEFIREAVAAGNIPQPGQAWDQGARDRLLEITQSHFREAERRGVTGRALLWDLAKQEILDDLETFLEEDASVRALHGTTRIMAEADFGMGGEALSVHDPETGLFFRGRIDRIDLSEDGASALVIDYKTGSPLPYKGLDDDVIDRGKRLQLGVYSLAAHTIFPESTDVTAAYWFTRTSARPRFAPSSHFDIDDGETRERFRHGVASIIEGIGAGLFPARPGAWVGHPENPGHENCRYCDFNSLCPARRGDLWQRKRSDLAVAGYLTLSGEDEEG